MRAVLLIYFSFLMGISNAQSDSYIEATDSTVTSIDKTFDQYNKFRYLLGQVEYWTSKGKFSKIKYSYKVGPRQIIDIFYINDSSLIFANIYGGSYYLYGDCIETLGKYYFIENTLRSYSTSTFENQGTSSQIQSFILSQFEKVKSAILYYKKKKNSG